LFAVLSPANQYLEVAIDLAVEKNGGKPVNIAMAFEQDAFSQDVRLGIVDAAKRTGSKIIIDDKLPKELNDMAATLAKVKATKPDVLVVSGHSKGALTAIRQISEMKVDVPMLAMTHCDASKLAKQHGKKSQEYKDYKNDVFRHSVEKQIAELSMQLGESQERFKSIKPICCRIGEFVHLARHVEHAIRRGIAGEHANG
jgi:ABC-type branched-subunit amino acid transport system substrate-binding protein